jgi:hydrogenase nickel incorporation protein HypA/HybF
MHEMSLCESILRIIERQAEKEGFSRVLKVRLEIGEHSGASEESLAFCFPFVTKGTVADGAELEFIRKPDGRTLRVGELEVG